MSEYDFPSAAESRQLAQAKRSEQSAAQIGKVREAIKRASERGEFSISLEMVLDSRFREALKQRGYTVREHHDQIAGVTTTHISWDRFSGVMFFGSSVPPL